MDLLAYVQGDPAAQFVLCVLVGIAVWKMTKKLLHLGVTVIILYTLGILLRQIGIL